MNVPAKINGVSIDPEMIGKADTLGIDVAHACEPGLYAAIKRTTDPRSAEEKHAADARWAQENREAMESWNLWLERHGMPFAEHRVV